MTPINPNANKIAYCVWAGGRVVAELHEAPGRCHRAIRQQMLRNWERLQLVDRPIELPADRRLAILRGVLVEYQLPGGPPVNPNQPEPRERRAQ